MMLATAVAAAGATTIAAAHAAAATGAATTAVMLATAVAATVAATVAAAHAAAAAAAAAAFVPESGRIATADESHRENCTEHFRRPPKEKELTLFRPASTGMVVAAEHPWPVIARRGDSRTTDVGAPCYTPTLLLTVGDQDMFRSPENIVRLGKKQVNWQCGKVIRSRRISVRLQRLCGMQHLQEIQGRPFACRSTEAHAAEARTGKVLACLNKPLYNQPAP
jgi:hypothetical protein